MKLKKYGILTIFLIPGVLYAGNREKSQGFVFSDTNQNGILDPGESGIAGVCVSNGKDVVQTDSFDRWELPGKNVSDVFVIKPTSFSVPLNPQNIPQHFFSPDDPNLFAEVSEGIGQIGIPWYNIFGNRDHDREEKLN